MINMRIVTKRIVSNYKHKRCKTRIIKMKITTTRKAISRYNEKKGERKR